MYRLTQFLRWLLGTPPLYVRGYDVGELLDVIQLNNGQIESLTLQVAELQDLLDRQGGRVASLHSPAAEGCYLVQCEGRGCWELRWWFGGGRGWFLAPQDAPVIAWAPLPELLVPARRELSGVAHA